MTAPAAAPGDRLRVPVHYDLASSLCYVAHRVLERMAPDLERLGVALVWSPVDLARLIGRRRGEPTPAWSLQNVERVARELEVPLRVPRVWLDSRAANAAALLAAKAGREPTWRERAFSAGFESGRFAESPEAVRRLAREIELAIEPAALEAAQRELEVRTEEARARLVTGVPTFMLGEWACGGIQTEDTMRHIFGRFAAKARTRMS